MIKFSAQNQPVSLHNTNMASAEDSYRSAPLGDFSAQPSKDARTAAAAPTARSRYGVQCGFELVASKVLNEFATSQLLCGFQRGVSPMVPKAMGSRLRQLRDVQMVRHRFGSVHLGKMWSTVLKQSVHRL